MLLKKLIDTHGVEAVAKTTGLTPAYIKRCVSQPDKYNMNRVKLANAAKKLGHARP